MTGASTTPDRDATDDWEITTREVDDRVKAGEDLLIIDCRTEPERAAASIDGSMHVPMHEIPERVGDLREHEDRAIIVYCHAGARSLRVTAFLRQEGFDDVRSMAGGIERWSVEIDPTVPRYAMSPGADLRVIDPGANHQLLRNRLITGTALIVVLIGVIMFDNWLDTFRLEGALARIFAGREYPPRGLVLFIVGLLIAPLAALELSRIFQKDGIATRAWLTSIAAMIGIAVSYAIPVETDAITSVAIVSTSMIIVFVGALLTFSQGRNVEGVVAAAGAVVFAMVYLGFMFGFLLALRREHSTWWVVGVIFVTKSCDTGAYFTGRSIGRHKMIPWLSPGKTWEGLAGGVALAALVGLGLAAASRTWLDPVDHVPWWLGLLAGVVFAIVGQCGDLTMSLFKHGAGIKDSSTLLPGLGGVLDVLDSPLMVAPVAYWLLELQ